MRIIIATTKSWNINNAIMFKDFYATEHEVTIISDKKDLNIDRIRDANPNLIFFPHWSWIIPPEIYKSFTCIVFHMTDLPFGRGGSPLQNLIERGIENTKLSAIRVGDGLDTGDIYIKADLNLNGTAEEIFIRASNVIFKRMIPNLIWNLPIPEKQFGQVVEFKRRKPEQSEISTDFDLQKIFDYIRMLDAEGYPKAYIKFGEYRMEFSRASLKSGKIIADVEIIGGEGNK